MLNKIEIILFLLCSIFTIDQCDAIKHFTMFQPLSDEMIYHINHANSTWKAEKSKRFQTVTDIRRTLGTIPDPSGNSLPTLCSGVSVLDTYIPKEFDSRVNWPHCPSISEIRDQSSCGSCWAFGAVESMSDRICIASNGKHKPFLSAENLVSCCKTCGMGCNGGFPHAAWSYWEKFGLVTGDLYNGTDSCQPYSFPPCEHHINGTRPPCSGESETPKCRTTCQSNYKIPYDKDKWYGKTCYRVNPKEDEIKKELMLHGPLEVDFEVYADFVNYKSGVYQHISGGLLGGHAVRLLGWGVENKTPYWLIANSWNNDWGDNGYFKILRGKNECGIETDINGGIPLFN